MPHVVREQKTSVYGLVCAWGSDGASSGHLNTAAMGTPTGGDTGTETGDLRGAAMGSKDNELQNE